MICKHNIESENGCKLCWKERAERAERAEAACGEMRAYIEMPVPANVPLVFWQTYDKAREHALSTSCGQGWLSPDKANALIDALEHIAKWTPASSHMRITDAPELAMKALAAAAKGEQK